MWRRIIAVRSAGRLRRLPRAAPLIGLVSLVLAAAVPVSTAQTSITLPTPARAPVGASVTIRGAGMSTTEAVLFGSTPAPFTVDSETEVTATVPPGAVSGPVTVTTADGSTTSAKAFDVLPNFLVVITDDQRWDTLRYMPSVRSQLIRHGITFPNAFVENPLCCPSRVSLLTGRSSHSTGIWTNAPPYGGFESFTADDQTVATWLDADGYETILTGKYLNRYWDTKGSYVPPGWDVWRAFASRNPYFDYALSIDGQSVEQYRTATKDYSTDVIAEEASSAIRAASAQDPLLVWFTPFAPHAPFQPAPRDVGTLDGIDPWRPPSYDEPDVSDKPGYVQANERFTLHRADEIDVTRQRQLEALGAVDDAVGTLLDALRDTGRLGDTMVIFTSDNGFLWGEHRRVGKVVPYEESNRVPFVVRWDRVISDPREDEHLVQNIDVAPTLLDASNSGAPPFDGSSLLPLLRNGVRSTRRSELLFEHLDQDYGVPSYCAIRTQRDKYVRYATGEQEYYRLGVDPWERINRVSDPSFAARIATLRDRARARCKPLPPDMRPF
jgi:N-acetylglucosamine-6-sulfatase